MSYLVFPLPLFTVLAHTNASSMAGSGIAAGTLSNLESDPTAGAARSPGRPWRPCPVSENGYVTAVITNQTLAQLAATI